MQTVIVCEKYGWTLDQYLDQPLDFLMLIRERMRIDAQRQQKEAKG